MPVPLLFQELMQGDIVCVVCENHPIGNQPLTEKKYLDCPHVLLTLLNPWQSVVDAALGKKLQQRRIGLRVPYYGAAVLAVPGTDLIAPPCLARLPKSTRTQRECASSLTPSMSGASAT